MPESTRQETSLRRSAVALAVLALLAVAAMPWLWIDRLAGDAVIHLVYGSNAAAGELFVFNPGQVSAGVTSPGWMLVVAGLFALLPPTAVPYALKALVLALWYGLVLLVFRLTRAACGDDGGGRAIPMALLAALTFGLMPGAAQNATSGMESVAFAAGWLGWLLVALRHGWPRLTSWPAALLLGLGAGALAWLRPEGLALVSALALRALWRSSGARGRAALFAAAAFSSAGAVIAFHGWHTGQWLPGSGVARILVAWESAVWLGPIPLSPKPLVRLAAYAPWTGCFLAGHVAARRAEGPRRELLATLIATFWAFLLLYATVLGSAHLARYTLFLMAGGTVVAAAGAGWLWWEALAGRPRLRRWMAVLGAVMLTAVYGYEAWLRTTDPRFGQPGDLRRAAGAPLEREATTRRLLDAAATTDRASDGPVDVALYEVQLRWFVDPRVRVWSLDGRTDPRLLDFVDRRGRTVDHVGYLRERGVELLLSPPRRAGSNLRALLSGEVGEAGEAARTDLLRLRPLPRGGWLVDPR